MFYKTSIKAEVAAISHDNPDLGKKVIDVLRTVYDDAIKRAKKTGESIESITYEILEGLEEGLMSKHQDIEPVLKVAADTMVELIYDHAQENIRNSQIKKDLAQEHFKEEVYYPVTLINNLSHESLSELIGSVRSVVSTQMHKLKEEEIIMSQRGHLVVKNLEKLIKKSDFFT